MRRRRRFKAKIRIKIRLKRMKVKRNQFKKITRKPRKTTNIKRNLIKN